MHAARWNVGLPNGPEWTRSAYKPYPYKSGDGRNGEGRSGLKVARGVKYQNVTTGRKRTRGPLVIKSIGEFDPVTSRMNFFYWQGVWNVGFRLVCLDAAP